MTEPAWAPPPEFDEYRLVKQLGAGAMGSVYLARDLALDRYVAIKLIAAVDPDPTSRQRFLTEARAIARLTHPNVVAVYRIGEVSKRPYLVSEYVAGTALDHLPRPVPWQRALDIGIDLARGLAAAHRSGVLHRDIKPANSMITADGVAKLLDFGLAKLLDERREEPVAPAPELASSPRVADSLDATADLGGHHRHAVLAVASASGMLEHADTNPAAPSDASTGEEMVGTPLFMAPEIWRGQPASRGSDVYALGTLLYELVAGCHPWRRPTSIDDLKWMIILEEPTPLAEHAEHVHLGLAAVIMRCLARLPDDRYDSGDALCTALEQVRAGTRAGELPAGNPYRGLSSFDAEHRSLFFGRTSEVREVLDRLRSEPFVLVAGDSGVGKSSLCRAGVLPMLVEGGDEWRVVPLFPGKTPFTALAETLGVPPAALSADEAARRLVGAVLFVDQLEEVVTIAEPEEAAAFARALAALATSRARVRLLGTVRGDFVTRLAALPAIGEHVSRAMYLLRPLEEDGLRDAIAGPARAKGFELESASLLESLVAAATGGGLPLLSFTLAALWDRRDEPRRLIPAGALDEIGGVGGALSRHADAALDSMLPAERAVAWRALDRLVTHEGTRAVLRRAELDELVAEAPQVVERLVAARLLVAAEERISIVHEVLVTGWPSFVAWRRDNAEGARLRNQLGDAARQWESRGRADGLLWRGEALAEYKVWRARHRDPLTAIEEAFATASVADERRGRRRRRSLVASAFVALLLGVFVLLHFLRQATRARADADDRLAQLYVEEGRQAYVDGHTLQALAFLTEAMRRGVDTPALRLLVGLSLRTLDAQLLRIDGHHAKVNDAVWSPDGRLIATAGDDRSVRIWDPASGRPVRVLTTKSGVDYLAFSPDGAKLAAGGLDGELKIWDVQSGAAIDLPGHTQRPRVVANPDGSGLVSTSRDPEGRVWDWNGRLIAKLPGHAKSERAEASAAYDPSGGRIVTADIAGVLRVWDAHTGALQATWATDAGAIVGVSFSHDGRHLLVLGGGQRVQIRDASVGDRVMELIGNVHDVRCGQFTPDDRAVVTGSDDGAVHVWDATTGLPRATLLGHTSAVVDVRVSSDGDRVLSASRDGTARLWSLAVGQSLGTFEGHWGAVRAARFSPDSAHALTASWDGTARVWDATVSTTRSLRGLGNFLQQVWVARGKLVALSDDGVVISDLGAPPTPERRLADATGASVSPDGTRLVVGDKQGSVSVLDTASGAVVARFTARAAITDGMDFTPDGERVIFGAADGTTTIGVIATGATQLMLPGHGEIEQVALAHDRVLTHDADGVELWDARDGRRIGLLSGHVMSINRNTAMFDPRGARVVAAVDDDVRVWNARDGAPLETLHGHTGGVWALAFSGDDRLVSGSQDGTAKVWDLARGVALGTLEGQAQAILYVAVSADGQLIATSSSDGSVALWDATRLKLLTMLRQGAAVRVVRFTGDAGVVSASDDGLVNIWSLPGFAGNFNELEKLEKCRLPVSVVNGAIISLPELQPDCY